MINYNNKNKPILRENFVNAFLSASLALVEIKNIKPDLYEIFRSLLGELMTDFVRWEILTEGDEQYNGLAQTSSAMPRDVSEYTNMVEHINSVAQTSFTTSEDIVKDSDMVQHINNVAQCRLAFLYKIKNLVNILSVIDIKLLDNKPSPLLARRDLLKLELAIFNIKFKYKTLPEKEILKREDLLRPAVSDIPATDVISDDIKINDTKRKILMIVRRNSKPVLNVEIFHNLSGVSRRNVKRNLKELIEAHIIERHAEGKKVSYFLAKSLVK